MTSSKLIKSLISILGGYSNFSAAGSRLKRWTERPRDCAWVMREAQKVDLPAPAGPVTRTASEMCKESVAVGFGSFRHELTSHVIVVVFVSGEVGQVSRWSSSKLRVYSAQARVWGSSPTEVCRLQEGTSSSVVRVDVEAEQGPKKLAHN